MPESFGARLRLRREEQNIALVTIAQHTKIKLSLLEGLERDDVSHWPSGIFRRAFLRAYAHHIGLDPDVVVREFLQVHPESGEVVEKTAVPAGAPRVQAKPPTRIRYMVTSAIEHLFKVGRNGAGAHPPPGPGRAETADSSRTPPADAGRTEPADPGWTEAADSGRTEPPSLGKTEPADPGKTEPTDPGRTDDVVPSALRIMPAHVEPDLLAVAALCTEIGRVENACDLPPLLREAARIVDAIGLIVWLWDESAAELRPALVHGYSDRFLAQLPPVRRDADNATAAAFRSAETSAISGSAHASGALVVPLLSWAGCAGVLAIELRQGSEQATSVRAVATILAALLTQVVVDPRGMELETETTSPPVSSFTEPISARPVRSHSGSPSST